jgi:hypothetical protein
MKRLYLRIKQTNKIVYKGQSLLNIRDVFGTLWYNKIRGDINGSKENGINKNIANTIRT